MTTDSHLTTHTVGGSSGWDTSVNYVNWAKGQTFTVGDSLLFNYGFTHSVDEVSQTDYTNCNTGNPISSDANSPTTIALSAAGTRYFICPRSNHCSQGMKLAVTVSASGTTPSPPSGGASPSPPSGGSTPPASSTPSSPPPPNGNAATTLGGGKSLMVGLSVVLVLGALLGVMG